MNNVRRTFAIALGATLMTGLAPAQADALTHEGVDNLSRSVKDTAKVVSDNAHAGINSINLPEPLARQLNDNTVRSLAAFNNDVDNATAHAHSYVKSQKNAYDQAVDTAARGVIEARKIDSDVKTSLNNAQVRAQDHLQFTYDNVAEQTSYTRDNVKKQADYTRDNVKKQVDYSVEGIKDLSSVSNPQEFVNEVHSQAQANVDNAKAAANRDFTNAKAAANRDFTNAQAATNRDFSASQNAWNTDVDNAQYGINRVAETATTFADDVTTQNVQSAVNTFNAQVDQVQQNVNNGMNAFANDANAFANQFAAQYLQ